VCAGDDDALVTVLPAAGHRRYRWRNGRGEAAEIAAEPGDNTAESRGWTLSIATVESDVAFSSFPGLDRHLMALSPAGLGLVIDGERRSLARWGVATFAGEAAVSSIGVQVPTVDLNLMVARERGKGSLFVRRVAGSSVLPGSSDCISFIVLLEGRLRILGRELGPLDVLRIDAGVQCRVTGTATVAIALICSRR
jgi:environmental stress-induced protein Ves